MIPTIKNTLKSRVKKKQTNTQVRNTCKTLKINIPKTGPTPHSPLTLRPVKRTPALSKSCSPAGEL